jgi:hypothetical protein
LVGRFPRGAARAPVQEPEAHKPDDRPIRLRAGSADLNFASISIFPPNRQPPAPSLRLQPKLAIGPVDDPLEREADRLADEAIRTPDAAVSVTAATGRLSRKCTACASEERAKLQASAERHGALEAPPIVREALRSPGRPLDPTVRQSFEVRLGRDFSGVRIHHDSRAAESAQAIEAAAYTVGRDIVFGAGRYAPYTGPGARLLAHELVHVVQQHGNMPVSRRDAARANGSNSKPNRGGMLGSSSPLVQRTKICSKRLQARALVCCSTIRI